jgi:hypothetical protein
VPNTALLVDQQRVHAGNAGGLMTDGPSVPDDYELNKPRRFRPVRQLGFRVLVVLVGMAAMAEVTSLVLNPGGGSGRGLEATGYILAAFVVVALILLLRRAGDAKRRWSRTAEVGDFRSVAAPILSAGLGQPTSLWRDGEYCLLLRPFGSDGSTICVGDPGRKRYSLLYHPTPTLEQVIDWTVRRKLGMTTLAVVNQDARFAPAGPEYLSCPPDHWRCQVGELIKNAHTIFLVLPPGQNIRGSFQWELEQITQLTMNSRVVLILPHPWNNEANGFYRAGREAAARIMALLVKFCGTFDEVRPEDEIAQSAALPPATTLVKMLGDDSRQFRCMMLPRARWTRKPVSWQYAVALQQVLDVQIREMEKSSFESRYPWRRMRPQCSCSSSS